MDQTRAKLISKSSDTVIDLVEARQHLNISHDDDNDLILSYCEAAHAFIEGVIGRPLLTSVYRYSMDVLPKRFMLGIGPVQSVDKIEVGITTIDPALYAIDLDSDPCRVEGKWVPRHVGLGGVKVTFTAGWESRDKLPADLKHAAKMLVSHYYENREAATSGGTTMQVMEVPFAVTALLDRYKTFGLV